MCVDLNDVEWGSKNELEAMKLQVQSIVRKERSKQSTTRALPRGKARAEYAVPNTDDSTDSVPASISQPVVIDNN